MTENKRAFILGLDGVPYTLLKQFIEKGIMPKLSAIVKEGAFVPMEASLPEVSSVSWTTFMTGVNPARHGIFGFMDLKPSSYDMFFPNFLDTKSQTLWDILGRHNKRSIVLNIPSTYPAKPLNGILTSGFVAIDLEKATYPKSAYEYLKNTGYRMDVEAEKISQDKNIEAFKKDVDITYQKRKEAFSYFLDNQAWDLFIAVITETDRLHHFFFDALEDQKHVMHDYLINFYRKVDELIGYFYEKTKSDNTIFIILSDHGFAVIKKEIYLNSWLKDKGYLVFNSNTPSSLSDINPKTQAFALDPSRVYINLEGKYPCGSVPKSEYATVRNRIKKELSEFILEGEKVIKKVFLKEEIYYGPYLENAPDIVALSHSGFDLKGTIKKNEVSGRGIFRGAHTQDNAVLFINRNINPQQDINIMDIAPAILTFMGLAGEAEKMDGREINIA